MVVRATVLDPLVVLSVCLSRRRPRVYKGNVFILARANVAIVVQDSTRRVRDRSGGSKMGRGGDRTTGFRIPRLKYIWEMCRCRRTETHSLTSAWASPFLRGLQVNAIAFENCETTSTRI